MDRYPLFPRLRSGHRLFQRPSPKSKFLAVLAGNDLDAELLDELLEDAEGSEITADESATPEAQGAEDESIDPVKLQREITELEDYIRWARGIGVDTKSAPCSRLSKSASVK